MTLPDDVTLRTATLDDIDAGAVLHAACWRETYADLVAPERLEPLLDEQRFREAWRRHLTTGAPRTLAVADGDPVGFSVAGPRDDEPDRLHLWALYVRGAWHGRGLGQALFDAAVGEQPCALWVLEDNHRAIGFYTRNGLRPDGRREIYEPFGTWEIRLVR